MTRRREPSQGRCRDDPDHRPGRRHRRNLVLEPVPGRDVRRGVLHLHADARRARLRARRALRLRAGRSACTSKPIAERFELVDDALFHTGVTRAEWDEGEARWHVRTDRGDEISCRWYVLAVGILNLMKLPAIAGMEGFAGHGLPLGAMGLRVHRRRTRPAPDQAEDRSVALVGTGAIGHPGPAAAGRGRQARLRLPAHAVSDRGAGQPPDRPGFADTLDRAGSRSGWTTSRPSCSGKSVDEDLIDDGWTHHYAAVNRPPRAQGHESRRSTSEPARRSTSGSWRSTGSASSELVDGSRARPRSSSPSTATSASDPASTTSTSRRTTSANVTLIDCPGGIERITEQGPVVDGRQYEVDCIMYGTGFEAERTPLSRRVGHEIVGRGGISLAEKWADGASTPVRDDEPGLPQPVRHAGARPAGRRHRELHPARRAGRRVRRPARWRSSTSAPSRSSTSSAEAEADWMQKVVDSYVDGSAVMSACTPSRINNEGDPGAMNPATATSAACSATASPTEICWRSGWVADGRSRADWRSRSRRAHRERAPAGRRGHRRRRRHRRGHRRGARPRRLVRGHRGSAGDPRRDRAAAAPVETTAGRIVAAGGSARASSASVTDGDAVRALFAELAEELGGLDAVVNVAGITRPRASPGAPTRTGSRLLDVHLERLSQRARGRAAPHGGGRARPHPRASPRARVGGRRTPARYSCAKRAVAALTWQLGRVAPPGVTVNAMSPIAATRMVTAAFERAQQAGHRRGGGGLSLDSMPGPDDLGPLGAHVSATASAGAAARSSSPVVPRWPSSIGPGCSRCSDRTTPRPCRRARAVVPRAFVAAEAKQTSDGGSQSALRRHLRRAGQLPAGRRRPPSGRAPWSPIAPTWRPRCARRSKRRGRSPASPRRTWPTASTAPPSRCAPPSTAAGPFDAVVVALEGHPRPSTALEGWEHVLADHRASRGRCTTTPPGLRATADYAAETDQPVRLVILIDATTPAGQSRAQAAAQLLGSPRPAPRDGVAVFTVGPRVRRTGPASRRRR